MIEDTSSGPGQLGVRDGKGSNSVYALGLFLSEQPGPRAAVSKLTGRETLNVLRGRYVWRLSPDTMIGELTDHHPLAKKAGPDEAAPSAAPSTQPAGTTATAPVATASAPAATKAASAPA
jgi:hypothetical protein